MFFDHKLFLNFTITLSITNSWSSQLRMLRWYFSYYVTVSQLLWKQVKVHPVGHFHDYELKQFLQHVAYDQVNLTYSDNFSQIICNQANSLFRKQRKKIQFIQMNSIGKSRKPRKFSFKYYWQVVCLFKQLNDTTRVAYLDKLAVFVLF